MLVMKSPTGPFKNLSCHAGDEITNSVDDVIINKPVLKPILGETKSLLW